MQQPAPTNPLYFLPAGSEIAALIRRKDWSQTPVGPPESWPLSLRTLINMMLTSRFPMLIFWGPALITFYNDAFRPSLGNNGKHPASLGQRGEESWAESWSVIGPMIYGIMAGDEAVWIEDQKLPIYREGQLGYAYWTYSFSPLTDDAGTVSGILVTCSETTQAVESRQRLADSKTQLQYLFQQAPMAICILRGPTFIIDLANEEQLHIWGRAGENLLEKPIFDAIPEAAGQGFEQLLEQVLTTGEPVYINEFSTRLRRSGQLETVYFNFVYRPLRDETNHIIGVISVAGDVTAQVLASQKIEDSEARFRSVVQQSPAATLVLRGDDFIIDQINPAMLAFMGRSQAVIGQPLLAVMPELDGQFAWQQVQRVYREGVSFDQHEVLVPHNRSGVLTDYYYNVAYRPLLERDQITGMIQVATDVTEQVFARRKLQESERRYRQLAEELEARVKQRTRDLERSNLDLMQFASVASHDLKEPIRKVQTFASRLQDLLADRMNEEEANLFERLVSSAVRMQTLVSDVLRLSKLSDTTSVFEPVDLNEVIHLIRDDLELAIREQGADFQAGTLPTVQAQPAQMHQLLLNLVSNALKFHDQRTPRIRVEPVPLTESIVAELGLPNPHQYAVVAVSDNGIGFDPKYKDQIFGMFQRLHGRSKFAGTGIGLTIVKRIVDNHRGYIDVQSQPGVGTTFRVALPLTPASDF